jgi:outer membrane receptor protein involved in Fe transport
VLDATLSGGLSRSVYMRRDHLTEAALFGELTYDLTSHLTATVGGRVFATRSETSADGFQLARPAVGRLSDKLTDRGFSPKVRLSYAFAPDIVLYVQATDGYRAGGFNVPASADGMAGGPDVASYRPDRLTNYEIGGVAALFNRSLTVRAAVFRAVWRDVQTDQFRASGLPVTLNIGDGSNTGVEVEAAWRPDSHWRLRVNALIDEPELTRSSNIFPARVDIGLPGVAKQTGSIDVTYGFDLPWDLRAELSAQAAYVGRSFLTFDGGTASAMGGYGQGRIAASLHSPDWRFEAFVNNVTDEAGNTFAFGNPFSRARTRQSTPLPPRTFGLAIRRSF